MESDAEDKVPSDKVHGDQKVEVTVQNGEVEVFTKDDEVDVVISDSSGEKTIVIVHTGHDDPGTHHHEHHKNDEHKGVEHPNAAHHKKHHEEHEPVEFIFVNEREVKVSAREMSGLQIKQAAIESGVNIKLDFVLAEEYSDKPSRIVGDADMVCLHQGMKFSAIRDDDNS